MMNRPLEVHEFWQLKHYTDDVANQLGWSKQQAKEYIQQKYGKSTRLAMSDSELLDLQDALGTLLV